jgi:hypothetical protein
MTEGVVYLAKAAGAHWLTDAVASYQCDQKIRAEPFQAWRLTVDLHTQRGELVITDGNIPTPLATQVLDYTDFPLEEMTLWLIADGEHWVLMLPSEY